jgi:hypothetical protein
MRAATVGRLLLIYLFYRQIISAIGSNSTAGHPQTVTAAGRADGGWRRRSGRRSFDEAAVEAVEGAGRRDRQYRPVLRRGRDSSRSESNLVIQSTLATYGYQLSPLELALWAIPTAIAAFFVHGARLLWMDRQFAGGLPRYRRGGPSLPPSREHKG